MQTHQRVQQISTLVDLSPTVLYDLHRLRWYGLIYPNRSPWNSFSDDIWDTSPVCGASFGLYEVEPFSHDSEYFDSWEHPPNDLYFDCLEEHLPDSPSHSLDFHDISSCCHYKDCTITSMPTEPFSTISPGAYHAAVHGLSSDLLQSTKYLFPVIFDTGASRSITGDINDFISPPTPLATPMVLGGMAQGLSIAGSGSVRWGFNTGTSTIVVTTHCYYVPDSKVRLMSPQRLFKKSENTGGCFSCKEEHAELAFDGLSIFDIPYDDSNYLPTAIGTNCPPHTSPQLNLCLSDESNQNLSGAQKLLLQWHYRFGHCNFSRVQEILRNLPFVPSQKFEAASRCIIPKCEVCEYAKAHRRPTSGKTSKTDISTNGHLSKIHLRVGQAVSVDHFTSRLSYVRVINWITYLTLSLTMYI